MLKESQNKEIEEAKDIGQGMVQMYQAGFLDGYNHSNSQNKKFRDIKDLCKKAFEKRFVKELQKLLGKQNRMKK